MPQPHRASLSSTRSSQWNFKSVSSSTLTASLVTVKLHRNFSFLLMGNENHYMIGSHYSELSIYAAYFVVPNAIDRHLCGDETSNFQTQIEAATNGPQELGDALYKASQNAFVLSYGGGAMAKLHRGQDSISHS